MIHFKLYVITDRHRCAPVPLVDVVSELLDAGVNAIQLREKDLSDTKLLRLAQPIAALCQNYGAKLFINTNARIALEIGAAGVHLPTDAVETQTSSNLYIGSSVHTLNAAQKRAAEAVDFVTYSPIYPTVSKPGYGPAVGIAGLAEVATGIKLPVFALGGITPARVPECLAAGAFGVAVMSGVMSMKGAGKRAKRYLAALESADR